MSFDPALFLEMPPSQYGATMTDPYTGLVIPKSVSENIVWRRKLIEQAKTSLSIRRSLRAACVKSPVFWLNAFGWTFLQKQVQQGGHTVAVSGAGSHVPFLTWRVQDDALVKLVGAIEGGYDATIHKARDMGASWTVVALFQWFFQFRPSTTFLELSRKEVLVDRRGDMDSLFEKHRYLMRWQPEWLRPQKLIDNSMHLENRDIGTTIEGESTNADAGQASRKTAILLDEFSRVKEGDEIDLATADTSACRIFNSTPGGPNTHFTRVWRQMKSGVRSGKIISLPWWMHPDKGRDARIETRETGDEVVSPWYLEEEKRRSKRNLSQNIKGEHGKAGDLFFDSDEIEVHRRAYQQDPLTVGNIKLVEDLTDDAKLAVVRRMEVAALVFVERPVFAPWRFWVPLVGGRPSQDTRYVFGVDISSGSGASNSVITVLDNSTNMIVAKWWDSFTSPEDLAEAVAMSGVWFGGRSPPLVIFEKNGPGVIFGRKLVSKMKYPNIYYQEIVDQRSKDKTRKWGWHSSDTKKQILLGEYREALKLNTIINPCRESLDEALEYTYDDKGRLEPGSLGEEEGGGKALHGDHVIADALVHFGRRDLPKVDHPAPARVPQGTPAARKQSRKAATDDSSVWNG